MKSSGNSDYIPAKGDIIWINFNPQSGREQSGRRPALAISPTAYNRRVKLILVCPIITKVKGYPLEISLPQGLYISGVILTDQVKSFDYQTRKAELICQLPDDVLIQVISNVIRLLNQ